MADQFEFEIPDDVFDKKPVDDGPSLAERLILDLDGFEGPLDVLLELARVHP